jgi:hypothetical protein
VEPRKHDPHVLVLTKFHTCATYVWIGDEENMGVFWYGKTKEERETT